jgi:hypothetical protein
MRPAFIASLLALALALTGCATDGTGSAPSRRAAPQGVSVAQPAAVTTAPAAFLAPATSTLPDLECAPVRITCIVYVATSRNYLTDRYKPRLYFQGEGGAAVYDVAACDELAAYLKAGGVRRIVLDWEQPDTTDNKAVARKIVLRLRSKGLRVSIWCAGNRPDGDAFWADLSEDLHPVFYNGAGEDFAAWKVRADGYLADIRRLYSTKKVYAWLSPQKDTHNTPAPSKEYLSDLEWTQRLAWCRDNDVDGVVAWMWRWVEPSYAYAPFDENEAWWKVYKRFARHPDTFDKVQ